MNLREQILRDEAMALYVGCSLEVMKGLEVWWTYHGGQMYG
jgi:hypothetical protein